MEKKGQKQMGPWAQSNYDYFYNSNPFVQESEILKDFLKTMHPLIWDQTTMHMSRRFVIKVLHIYPDILQDRRWKEESRMIYRSEAFWVKESFRYLKTLKMIRKIQADIKMGKYRLKREKYFIN